MFSTMRRRIGVLTAIAVMSALVPTLAVSPASALPESAKGLTAASPGNGHTYLACPTGSAAAAGFTDTTSTDVDCIAMYGITTGVTATTYEPSANIPRWQMALYLTRALNIAGYTLGSGADQGFTDISGYSADIQTAINQLAQSGVTTGTTATTFSPDTNTTREQMAMFVERTLGKVAAGVGGSATTANNVNVNADGTTYNYLDIDGGSVTYEGHNAIIELFHLGVPGHTNAETAFSPSADITRADMATWLTNALDHTNARPAGVTLQASQYTGYGALTPSLHISHRTDAHVPIAGTVIDVFEWANSTVEGNNAFSATTGLCDDSVATGNSLTACVIDVGDSVTDSSGNLATIPEAVGASTTNSYWAWTAASGTKYTNGTTTGGSTRDVAASGAMALLVMAPSSATLGDEMNASGADNASVNGSGYTPVKFGEDVTINMTLMNATATAVTAIPLTLITCVHTVKTDGDAATLSTTTTKVYTDANGTASFTISQADPAPLTAVAGDALNHVVTCTSAAGGGVYSGTNPAETSANTAAGGAVSSLVASGVLRIRYTDVASVAKRTVVTQNAKYGIAGSALAPVTRSATATLYDQYGKGISGDIVVMGGACHALGDVATNNAIDVVGVDPANDVTVRFTGMSATMAAVYTEGALYHVVSGAANATTFSTTQDGTVVAFTHGDVVTTGDAVVVTASGASASRVTDSNGVATMAWSDTGTTAAKDTVVACAGDGTNNVVTDGTDAGQSHYYRALDPSSVTAITGHIVPYALTAIASGDNDVATVLKTVVINATEFVVEVDYDLSANNTANAATTWLRYKYDANDQFTCDPGGTATLCTYAEWSAGVAGTSTVHTGWASDVGTDALGVSSATYSAAGLSTTVHAFAWTEQ